MKKTLNQHLAQNLQREMKARGLSAVALSKKAGVAANTIGRYLRLSAEDSNPSSISGKERSAKLTEVELIATALRIPPLELLAPVAESQLKPAQIKSRIGDEILEILARLPKHHQALLLSLATALADTR